MSGLDFGGESDIAPHLSRQRSHGDYRNISGRKRRRELARPQLIAEYGEPLVELERFTATFLDLHALSHAREV